MLNKKSSTVKTKTVTDSADNNKKIKTKKMPIVYVNLYNSQY